MAQLVTLPEIGSGDTTPTGVLGTTADILAYAKANIANSTDYTSLSSSARDVIVKQASRDFMRLDWTGSPVLSSQRYSFPRAYQVSLNGDTYYPTGNELPVEVQEAIAIQCVWVASANRTARPITDATQVGDIKLTLNVAGRSAYSPEAISHIKFLLSRLPSIPGSLSSIQLRK